MFSLVVPLFPHFVPSFTLSRTLEGDEPPLASSPRPPCSPLRHWGQSCFSPPACFRAVKSLPLPPWLEGPPTCVHVYFHFARGLRNPLSFGGLRKIVFTFFVLAPAAPANLPGAAFLFLSCLPPAIFFCAVRGECCLTTAFTPPLRRVREGKTTSVEVPSLFATVRRAFELCTVCCEFPFSRISVPSSSTSRHPQTSRPEPPPHYFRSRTRLPSRFLLPPPAFPLNRAFQGESVRPSVLLSSPKSLGPAMTSPSVCPVAFFSPCFFTPLAFQLFRCSQVSPLFLPVSLLSLPDGPARGLVFLCTPIPVILQKFFSIGSPCLPATAPYIHPGSRCSPGFFFFLTPTLLPFPAISFQKPFFAQVSGEGEKCLVPFLLKTSPCSVALLLI